MMNLILFWFVYKGLFQNIYENSDAFLSLLHFRIFLSSSAVLFIIEMANPQ